MKSVHFLIMLKIILLHSLGEQEVTARTAGYSSVIILATIVPLLLLIIIVFYRYVKEKNLEMAMMQEKEYFAEMEKHRRLLYNKMQAEHQKREKEISELLDRKLLDEKPSTSSGGGYNHAQFNMINVDNVDDGDLTDDEFFEEPLPPLPLSGQTSITDNEIVEAKTPSAKVQETPKVDNFQNFKFPPKPTRAPPLPPLQIPPQTTFLPPLPPRPATASPNSNFPVIMNPNRISTHPTIIDVTPNSMLESEL